MHMICVLLVGIAAGWLAGQIMKGSSFGLIGDLVVGVLGSIVGGVFFQLIGLSAYGLVGNLIMSTCGAVVLLYVIRRIR